MTKQEAKQDFIMRRRKAILQVLEDLGKPETAGGIMAKLPREFKDFNNHAIYRDCLNLVKADVLQKWGGKAKRLAFGLKEHSLDESLIPRKTSEYREIPKPEKVILNRRRPLAGSFDMDARTSK